MARAAADWATCVAGTWARVSSELKCVSLAPNPLLLPLPLPILQFLTQLLKVLKHCPPLLARRCAEHRHAEMQQPVNLVVVVNRRCWRGGVPWWWQCCGHRGDLETNFGQQFRGHRGHGIGRRSKRCAVALRILAIFSSLLSHDRHELLRERHQCRVGPCVFRCDTWSLWCSRPPLLVGVAHAEAQMFERSLLIMLGAWLRWRVRAGDRC